PWDLAQFGLASSGRGRAVKKFGALLRDWTTAPRWRAARWGIGLLVVTQLIGLNAWAWRENAALADKRDAINGTLKSTFPGVQVIVDAPVQMERELALLRQGAGAASGRDFEAMLSVLSTALAQLAPQSPPPMGLEFANGELRLKGLNLNGEQVAAIADRLRGAGLSARTDANSLLVRPQAVATAGAAP
ncbi:MAG: type II secretion system protein GspL, partial [Burkholderiales bacterium]